MSMFLNLKMYAGLVKQPQPPLPAGRAAYAPYEEEDVPEKDRLVAAGIKEGNACFIIYEDSKGNRSSRRITINGIKEKNGARFIYAFCHERKAMRSFRADRIVEVTDLATGEIHNKKKEIGAAISDVDEKISSPTIKAVREHRDSLNIMAFLSRCDGRQHPAERDVMNEYMMKECFFDDLDSDFLDHYIRRLYPNEFVFHANLQRAQKQKTLKKIMVYGVRLIEADGVIHPKEHELVQKIHADLM